ncbi:hypothetical protein QTP86_017573, partial [Hemibagrus guttatus]
VPYSDLPFHCSGWPLCLYDHIVIHLAPINPLLLSFEDFYLQVVPFKKQAVYIVVRSLLDEEQHDLEETPIPEDSFSRIFTQDWLKELNVGRHGRLLRHCVLATEQCIVKVPWDQVAYPELQHMDSSGISNQQQPLDRPSWQGYSVETRICPAKDGIAVSLCLVDSSRQSMMNQAMPEVKPLGWVSPNTWDSRSKACFVDEDVNNVEQTSAQLRTCLQKPHKPPVDQGHDRPTCGRTVRFAEQPCTPCLRRKHGQGTKNQECRYKEYCGEEQCSVRSENRIKEPVIYERPVRTDYLNRPVLKLFPEIQTTNNNSSENHRKFTEHSQGILADMTELSEGLIACITPNMVETEPEKSHTVVRGYPSEGKSDSKTNMTPRLHVDTGKKTTSFGLVSPKLNRRKQPVQGGRDHTNRVVVEVYGDHQHWRSPLMSSRALCKLLLYFHTITRKDEREFGMMVVYDSRKIPPYPEFFEALQMVQEQNPKAVHCVLLLISKEKSYSSRKYHGDMEVVTSLKALHRYIDYSQLSPALEGTFLYSHRNWLHLHQELYPFVFAMKEASNLLQEAIRKLEGVHKIDTAQDVQQCINDQRVLMKDVLEDTQLVTLQKESGALLARLRWESDARGAHYETSCKVMDTVDALYNEVEEHVHVLIKEWFDVEGERRILEAESAEEPSRSFEEILQCLTAVLSEANEHKLQAMMLLNEAECIQGPNYPEMEVFNIMISTFKSNLSEFLSQAKQYCDELKTMLNLCHFCERASFLFFATEVATDCSQQLEQERLQYMNHQEKWATLQGCHEKLSQFSPEHFQEAKTQACSLQNSWGKKVWNLTWLRCQEVSQQLEDILQELEQDQQPSVPVSLHYQQHSNAEQESTDVGPSLPQPDTHQNELECTEVNVQNNRDSIHGTVSCFNISFRQSRKGRNIFLNPSFCHRRLQCIMEELLLTELEYVRSLAYILTHYLPLLARPDVPPDLRGQRGRIFGNLENLYAFHCHYFLQELEACRTEPLHVGRCFLRHRENFGLYALYSKNKPQSDALIQQHKYFKSKQLELGDSMDLSSYLLKPVQRISKYSLLLQEMLEECGSAHDAERKEIHGAAEVVRFQLRHGNDLLTMDAIQDCDVNLQEQGQLIRQDELYITFRKKRALRRVFLFQDLILFTKTKKTHRGDDVYVYKQSFKTCDIGLTQNCGQSGLCFEIWFRRRRAQDTYTLQAERQDMKEAWTADLERILWEQALKNRELRRQEQVFMGMGSKPFMKIQPKEADVHVRTITSFFQEGAAAETEGLKSPNLTAPRHQSDTSLPRPESIGSTSGSQSSSSSGRGSLSPSNFHENQVPENGHGAQIPQIGHQSNGHGVQIPQIGHQSNGHGASTESPGPCGSRVCGSSCSCSITGGRFTTPTGPQMQQTSPALSRKKGLSSTAHKIQSSYFSEG